MKKMFLALAAAAVTLAALSAPAQAQPYHGDRDYRPGSSEWLIVESLGEAAEADIFDRFGQRFSLDGRFLTGAFSGTSWYLYRRTAATGVVSSLVN